MQKVVDKNGEDLYEYKQRSKEAVDPDIAADCPTPCSRSSRTAPGTEALALDRPAAGKTGTATNDDDEVSSSWFVGYTPQMSTAVMYVRGDGDDQLDGWLPSTSAPTTPPRPGPRSWDG